MCKRGQGKKLAKRYENKDWGDQVLFAIATLMVVSVLSNLKLYYK
jgi:hypothetical protein